MRQKWPPSAWARAWLMHPVTGDSFWDGKHSKTSRFSVESNSLFCMRWIDMSGQQSKMKANDQSGRCYFTTAAQNSLVSDEPNWTTGDLLQTMVNLPELEIMWWHWSQNHNHTSGDTSLVPSGRDLNTKAPHYNLSSVKGEQLNNLHINEETTKPLSSLQARGGRVKTGHLGT